MIDIEEFEKFFLEANLNECMIYCKDHWGNSYYDTKNRKNPWWPETGLDPSADTGSEKA